MNGKKAKQLRKSAKIVSARKYDGNEKVEKTLYKLFKRHK